MDKTDRHQLLEAVLGIPCRNDQCPYCRKPVLAGMFTKDHVIPRAARACHRGNADVCPLSVAKFHNPLLDKATCFKSEGVKSRCFVESPENILAVCKECNNRKKGKALKAFLNETGIVPRELNPGWVDLNPSSPGATRLRLVVLNDIPEGLISPSAPSKKPVRHSREANTLNVIMGRGHTLTPPIEWFPVPKPSMDAGWTMGIHQVNLAWVDRDADKVVGVPIRLSPFLFADGGIVALHVNAPRLSEQGAYMKSASTLLSNADLPIAFTLWHKAFWVYVLLDFTKWFVSHIGLRHPEIKIRMMRDPFADVRPQFAFSLNTS